MASRLSFEPNNLARRYSRLVCPSAITPLEAAFCAVFSVANSCADFSTLSSAAFAAWASGVIAAKSCAALVAAFDLNPKTANCSFACSFNACANKVFSNDFASTESFSISPDFNAAANGFKSPFSSAV